MIAGIYPSSNGYSPKLGNPLVNPVLFLLRSKEAVNNFRLSRKLDVHFVHLPASDNWLPKTCLAQCHALWSYLSQLDCSIVLPTQAGQREVPTHTAACPTLPHFLCTALDCKAVHKQRTWESSELFFLCDQIVQLQCRASVRMW